MSDSIEAQTSNFAHQYFQKNYFRRKWMLFALVGILFLALSWACIWTGLSIHAATNRQLASASQRAKLAQPVIRVLSSLTLHAIPDIEVWRSSLELVVSTQTATEQIQRSLPRSTDTFLFDLTPLAGVVENIQPPLQIIDDNIDQTVVAKRLLTTEQRSQLASATTIAQQVSPLLQQLSQGEYKWLIIFQNSHEIRASGGFMGSYALVSIQDGKVTELVVEDIYDADGQFAGFVPAPPGVEEYLSSARGLRLPDANWDADFAQSAQHILQFFALGNRQNIIGLTTVNLEVAESILEVTGPIWLPDYQREVSNQDLAQVLGSHREEFFAGSIQKKQMLSHLMTQLRFELTQLNSDQIKELLKKVGAHTQTKDVQFYSPQEEWQQLFMSLGLSGSIDRPDEFATADLLYWLESNVGINKANQAVERFLTIDIAEQDRSSIGRAGITDQNTSAPTGIRVQVAGTFTNHNPDTPYANYQRVLVSPSWNVLEITFQETPVETWDETIITTSSGLELKQIGFILLVPPESQSIASITFETSKAPSSLYLLKQPGLPSFPVSVTKDRLLFNLLLDINRGIHLTN